MKRTMKTVLLTMITVLMLGTTAFAGERLTQDNFDYDWYLEQHPDLAALGLDEAAIWEFYQTTGEPAGWVGRATKASYVTASNFDANAYLTANPDLAVNIGTDTETLWWHWVNYGQYEGRSITTTSATANAKMKCYDILESITNDSMSDREIVKAVHDWMCKNIAYDYDNYLNNTIPDESYEISGAILNGKAVCDGYSKTFLFFMTIAGIECERVTGTATNSSGHTGGHAWNQVKVDGQWYNIDVTWDDPVPDRGYGVVYGYKYYLLSNAQMNTNHFPETTIHDC